MSSVQPLEGGEITVQDAGEMLVDGLRARGRKRATCETYESAIRVQLAPYFGERRLDRIGRREIEGFIRYMGRTGRATEDDAQRARHPAFDLRARKTRGLGRRQPLHARR